MPLTVPQFPAGSQQCSVSVASTDAGCGIYFTLTQDQIETWSDEDIRSKITALATALRGLLYPGADIQSNVSWSSAASATAIHEYETVPAL